MSNWKYSEIAVIARNGSTATSRGNANERRGKGVWKPVWLVAFLVSLLAPATAYAVCFGEFLSTQTVAANHLPNAEAVRAGEHPGTVRGGQHAETLIDPGNPPPQPGSDPSAAAVVQDPTRAAAGMTNIGSAASPKNVGTQSVAELTHAANSGHGAEGSSPFVDGHLINGDYYGNSYPDDRNFVTLTTKANSDHKGLETKVKSMVTRLGQVYHSFGNDQARFCAHETVGGMQVSYKPVVHVRTEVSTESVRQFESVAGNPDILFLDLDSSLPAAQQAAIESKITEGMPAWIEMKTTLYMEEYQLNPATNRWEPQQRYKVMPRDVADSMFRQKTTSSGQVKRNFLGGTGGLSFGEAGGGAKVQYEYVPGVGPQVGGKVYNWGPLKADIIANGQNAASHWPPGITNP